MEIPREDWLAAFPPTRAAGNVKLKPLTLAGAIRLGERGISFSRRVPDGKVVEAAFVLSGGADFARFCRHARCGLKELARAVEATLNDAFVTYVRPYVTGGGAVQNLTPNGLGWPLELAEWLCAEYGWRWGEALETPVVTVYALAAACRKRNGGRHAWLDYIERQYSADLKAGRAKAFTLDGGKEAAADG